MGYRIPKKAPSASPPPVTEKPRWEKRPSGPVELDRIALKRRREQEAYQVQHAARAEERQEQSRRREAEAKLQRDRELRARQEEDKEAERRWRGAEAAKAAALDDLRQLLALFRPEP